MKEITIQEAESLAGCRLDRRRKYATTDDGKKDELTSALVFACGHFVLPCSGCHETNEGYEYPGTKFHPKWGVAIGAGCDECRGHGIRHESMWMPHDIFREVESL